MPLRAASEEDVIYVSIDPFMNIHSNHFHTMTKPAPNGEMPYFWHNQVHENVGQYLAYFQLSFAFYNRKRVFETLLKLFVEENIGSFCIYETYGVYDVMIRAWLPVEIPSATFTVKLRDRLRSVNCTRVLPFYVGEIIHHWAWWNPEQQQLVSPSSKDLKEFSLETAHHVALGETWLLEELVDKNLLHVNAPEQVGMKFFIAIPPSTGGVDPTEEMERHVDEELRDLLIAPKFVEHIVEPSIYTGTGFARVLIKGKIRFDSQVESFRYLDELIQSINEKGARGFYVRSYTYLVSPSSNMVERELLPAPNVNASIDIEEFLLLPEDDRFEVKASIFVNVDRFVRQPDYKLEKDLNIAVGGVVKTVAAFLNSHGGILVIGAMEVRKYAADLSKEGSRLAEFPVRGLESDRRIIFGIDSDLKLTKNQDVDELKNALTELIQIHIGAAASALIRITVHEIEGRQLLVVRVPKGTQWYYVDEAKFYVRRDGSTLALEARQRQDYQEEIRRRS